MVSSNVVTVLSDAVGASLTPVTVIVISAVVVAPVVSVTVYVNTSVTVSLASKSSAAD